MGTEPSVAVVGSYNVGFTMEVPRFPTPGETVIGEGFTEGPGGKGSNQAVAAARLGAAVGLVARIGEDRYGDDAIALWGRESVGTTHVRRDGTTHTGAGFVIVDEAGENEITVAPGANDRLTSGDIRSASNAIASADALLVQLEIPTDAVEAAVEVAAHAGVPVVLNPAPARELPATILEHLTFLTPNQSEARILAGEAPDAAVDDGETAEALLELGVETVVLTRGADGAAVFDGTAPVEVPAPSVDVVDTTGAGDAFNAAFAVALAEGRSVRDAVRFGCSAGTRTVTTLEVIPGLPDRDAVDAILESTYPDD